MFRLRVNPDRVFLFQREGCVRDMHTVEIPVDRADLRDQMSAMRTWLDERRYETSGFKYNQDIGGILLTVVFNLAEEAEAFANRFGGRLAGVGIPIGADGHRP